MYTILYIYYKLYTIGTGVGTSVTNPLYFPVHYTSLIVRSWGRSKFRMRHPPTAGFSGGRARARSTNNPGEGCIFSGNSRAPIVPEVSENPESAVLRVALRRYTASMVVVFCFWGAAAGLIAAPRTDRGVDGCPGNTVVCVCVLT